MIVSRREALRVFEGRKRQHRFPRERHCPSIGHVKPVRYREPNPALGYQRNGEPKLDLIRVCHVRITDRWEAVVNSASSRDLSDEGYGSFDEFQEDWPIQTQFVWVVRFALEHVEMPRLLSNRIVAGKQGAYVNHLARAVRGEMEALDEATQDRYSQEARERDVARELERREGRNHLPFDLRVRALEAEARRRHIDIRDELRAIRRWSDPVARERQLVRMQAKLDAPIAA